jgi:hypothetical protein
LASTFDGVTRTISPSVGDSLDVIEMYSEWKLWAKTAEGSKYAFALRPEGGDTLPAYVWLSDDWNVAIPVGSATYQITGNLYPETPNRDMFTGSTRRVALLRSLYTSYETIAVGSGVTEQDKIDIAAGAKAAILSDNTAFPGARIDAAVSSRAVAGEGLTTGERLLLARLDLITTELHKLQGLDVANPVTITPTGLTAGTLTQTYENTPATDTTVVTRTA